MSCLACSEKGWRDCNRFRTGMLALTMSSASARRDRAKHCLFLRMSGGIIPLTTCSMKVGVDRMHPDTIRRPLFRAASSRCVWQACAQMRAGAFKCKLCERRIKCSLCKCSASESNANAQQLNQMHLHLNQMQMHLHQMQTVFYNCLCFLCSASATLQKYLVITINQAYIPTVIII